MMSDYKTLGGFGNVDAAGGARTFISYLDEAGALLRDAKRFGFELLRLKPGSKVLDVGCGTGDDVRTMRELAGPAGMVVGVDSSEAMIAAARSRGVDSGVAFELGDVNRLKFEADSFDVCRAERLFQHLRDPEKAILEMVRVVKPGGTVMVLDADHGMSAMDATDAATTQIVIDLLCRNIVNSRIGRKLFGLFRGSNLQEVRVEFVPGLWTDYRVANSIIGFESLVRQAVEEGLVTLGASEEWLRDLNDRQRQGRFFFAAAGFFVLGTKPLPAK